MSDNEKMKILTVYLPESILDGLNKLIKEEKYPNKHIAIVFAVSNLVISDLFSEKENKKNQ